MKAEELEKLKQVADVCTKCKLSTTRTKVVFGEGNPEAELLFIGEGPGRQEDVTGRPFVGKAGELLTRLIEKAMGVPRSSVYIANIAKCRPNPEEVTACSPYLLRQIEIIQPKVIVTLGNPSTKFLLKTQDGITKLRGVWADYNGIPVMPTYHPSYVIRNGGENSKVQQDVWNDLLKVMEKLNWKPKVKITWK